MLLSQCDVISKWALDQQFIRCNVLREIAMAATLQHPMRTFRTIAVVRTAQYPIVMYYKMPCAKMGYCCTGVTHIHVYTPPKQPLPAATAVEQWIACLNFGALSLHALCAVSVKERLPLTENMKRSIDSRPFNATFSGKRQVKFCQCSGAAFYNTER